MAEPQLELLKKKRFLPLFVTQFLGAFNDNLFKNSLILLFTYVVAAEMQVEPELLGTVAAGLFILPFFLFSALAGQLADKMEKSGLIRRIKMLEVALMVLAAIGFLFSNTYMLLAVLFLMGAQSTFFGPLKYGILPDHLKEEELIGGNALIEMGTFLSILIGTIMGLVVQAPGGKEIVSVLLILVAVGGYVAARKIPAASAGMPDLKINWNFISETVAIVGQVKKREVLYHAILGISWFWFVGATFLTLFPAYAQKTIGAEEALVTLFLALFSIGIAVGSLVCNRLLKGMVSARFVPIAAVVMAIFCIDMYFASNRLAPEGGGLLTVAEFLAMPASWRILVDMLGAAIAGGIYIVPLYAILQARSPKPIRARVIAANNILNALFMVASAVITAVLTGIGFSIPAMFLVVGIFSTFVAVYIVQLLPQDLVQSIVRTLLKTFYRVEVKGLENYQKVSNKTVIIANHTSFLDGLLLGAFIPHQLTFAINTHIAQKWWVRPAFILFDLLTLDPTNPMATKSLVKEVKKGRRIVIFPEGRLTVTGALMKVYEGPGTIAHLAHAPILPIRIEGAQFTPFSRLKGVLRLRWFPKITLNIQPPVRFEAPEGLSARGRRQWLAEALYNQMSNLMFTTSNTDRTLFESLIDARSVHGGKQVVLEDIERNPVNYKKLILGSFALGRRLKKNTKPREIVGLFLPNSVGAVVTFFALQAYGRVPAMLNYSTGVKNIKAACTAAEIKTILTSKRFIEAGGMEDIAAVLSDKYRLVYLEDIKEKVGLGDKLFALIARLSPEFWHHRMSQGTKPDEAGVVLFTSGSEGMPKGVVLSHKNIQSNRLQLSAIVDFTPSDTVFNALPIFHSFGLTGGLLLPVLSGLKVFLYPSPLHYRIVPELVYETNSTIMFGTDTFLSGYARFAHAYDFYSMRYVFAGAEKLKPETRRLYANKFGVRIFEGYGATETSPVLAVNTPMHIKQDTVGRLLPGIQYKLEPVPGIEEGGKLVVTGPNIMMGYLRVDKPGVLEKPEGGWYDTGDIVEIDTEGFVAIKGRAKRFAKVAGEMVSLTAVEGVVSDLWPDEAHAVVAVSDVKKGEQLVLLTTRKGAEGSEVSAKLQAEGMSGLMLPKYIKVVDEIPVLGTGKTDYVTAQLLADEYAS
ncbi:acyl-[ACP]--phospholipid O-acyltransferase [Kordiimonas pumila]|uniref:Acyl-[ACP]--phospholipid O-acyltransferase n=1 Tax=Kordiimonas pumila TaxID=2161677 RepID=A0ABV7D4S1_9PROT|nr:acyl-[ACP]--phospholipid O-acyltransferase [Kordiimonas pumila]